MTAVIIDLLARLRRPLRIASRDPDWLPPPGPPYRHTPPPGGWPSTIEVVHYERAAIHEGVPLVQLVSALNRAGFTVSNLQHRGLVIHRMGQNPARPHTLFHIEDHPA